MNVERELRDKIFELNGYLAALEQQSRLGPSVPEWDYVKDQIKQLKEILTNQDNENKPKPKEKEIDKDLSKEIFDRFKKEDPPPITPYPNQPYFGPFWWDQRRIGDPNRVYCSGIGYAPGDIPGVETIDPNRDSVKDERNITSLESGVSITKGLTLDRSMIAYNPDNIDISVPASSVASIEFDLEPESNDSQ